MVNRPACAACRHQRKKCKKDCILAPYFPINKLQDYEDVHRVFGYSNIAKILQNLGEQERQKAINSFEWEAKMWTQDPIFGPFGAYNEAMKMISHLWNLLQQQQQQAHQRVFEPNKFMGQAQVSLPFSNEALPVSNNINWASFDSPYVVSSNVVQNPNFEYPYVNYFGDSLQNEEPNNVLKCVPSGNVLQPSLSNYLQSVAGSSGTNLTMDRHFQYCDENVVSNEEMGMQREGQGNYGIDIMAQNRVRSQITELQHPIHHPFGHNLLSNGVTEQQAADE